MRVFYRKRNEGKQILGYSLIILVHESWHPLRNVSPQPRDNVLVYQWWRRRFEFL